MRRLAAPFAFVLIVASSALARADVGPDPEPSESSSSSSEGGGDTSTEDKGCSLGGEQSSLFGLAALALLVSGAALRRRH